MTTPGAMLRLARQLRGMLQNDAAEELGVLSAELSRVENGLKPPSGELLRAASQRFELPLEFFQQTDTLYGAPVSVHNMWRRKTDVPAGELHRLVADLNVRAMHIRRLLDAADHEPQRELPHFDSDDYGNSGEAVADLMRRFWRLPAGPIDNLTALVEEAGVVVLHSELGETSISGVTFSVPGVPPIILLNSSQPADRQRFTLAHELGHLVMHRFPTPNLEKEADEFASCFLVPTADIKPAFKGRRVDLRLLAALKPEWRVSMGMLVFAAERAGALNKAQMTYIWKLFSVNKIKLREPPELDFPPEQPRTMGDFISLHMRDLGLSVADLAKMLHMHEAEVAKTYSIALPGEGKSKGSHLRIV